MHLAGWLLLFSSLLWITLLCLLSLFRSCPTCLSSHIPEGPESFLCHPFVSLGNPYVSFSYFLLFILSLSYWYSTLLLSHKCFSCGPPSSPLFYLQLSWYSHQYTFFLQVYHWLQGCAACHLNLNPFRTFRGGWLAQKTAEIRQQPAGSIVLCYIDAVRILHRVLHGLFVITNIFKNHPYLFIVCYITWSIY